MKEETGKWWKQSASDLATAEYNLKGKRLSAAAFYSHQGGGRVGRTQPEMISKLRAFRRSVARKYGIEKAILFGSHATGRQRKDSDVDILVVSRRKGKLRLISALS